MIDPWDVLSIPLLPVFLLFNCGSAYGMLKPSTFHSLLLKEMFQSLILLANLLIPDQADSDPVLACTNQKARKQSGVSGSDTAALTNEPSCCSKKILSFLPHDTVCLRVPFWLHSHIVKAHNFSQNFNASLARMKQPRNMFVFFFVFFSHMTIRAKPIKQFNSLPF